MLLKETAGKTGIILFVLMLSVTACFAQTPSVFQAISNQGWYNQVAGYNLEVNDATTTGGRFIVHTNGNVGIGIANPTHKLHLNNGLFAVSKNNVTTTMGTFGNVGGTNFGWVGTVDYSSFSLGTVGTQRLTINSDGSVGIGITNPSSSYKLHVNGGLRVETNYSMGGSGTFQIDAPNFVGGRLSVTSDGNVGIGTGPTSQTDKFTVKYTGNNLGVCHTDGTVKIGTKINASVAYIGTYTNNPLNFITNNSSTPQMTITTNGNVGIGTTTPGAYKLAVEGTLGARTIQVKATSWADFVFDKNYKLRPLKEVEDFINANKHLPGVPSGEQVKKEGINVADMNAILLQKIEELTLYAIEQNKYAIEQNKRIEAIEKENALLKEKLNRQ